MRTEIDSNFSFDLPKNSNLLDEWEIMANHVNSLEEEVHMQLSLIHI